MRPELWDIALKTRRVIGGFFFINIRLISPFCLRGLSRLTLHSSFRVKPNCDKIRSVHIVVHTFNESYGPVWHVFSRFIVLGQVVIVQGKREKSNGIKEKCSRVEPKQSLFEKRYLAGFFDHVKEGDQWTQNYCYIKNHRRPGRALKEVLDPNAIDCRITCEKQAPNPKTAG